MREISNPAITMTVRVELSERACDCLRAAMRGYLATSVRHAANPPTHRAGWSRSFDNALVRVAAILQQHGAKASKDDALTLICKAERIALKEAAHA